MDPREMTRASARTYLEMMNWQARQERIARLPLVRGIWILLNEVNQNALGGLGFVEIEPLENDVDPITLRLGWESPSKKRFSREMDKGVGKPEMPNFLRIKIESSPKEGDLTYWLSANYSGQEDGEHDINHVGPGLTSLKEALRMENGNIINSSNS